MLKKILCVENVGKFRSCKPKGDVEFRRLNLIYAENGRGKTTLCDVLRSLQTGNGDYVHGRATLGLEGEPLVELRLKDQNARFERGEWSVTFPNIAVFDSAFVHENVHTGEFIEHDQKRNLYTVIVGARGVALQRRVDELDAESREAAKRLRNAQQGLRGYVPEGMDEKAFVELRGEDDLDRKIAAKEAELRALKRASDIASKSVLAPLELPTVPSGFEAALTKTIEDVAADVEARVREHLAIHTRAATDAWVSEGVRYQKDDICPFCGQQTSGLALVEAYRAYFSAGYRELKKEVDTLRGQVERIGSDATAVTLARVVEQNQALTEFWKEFVSYDEPQLPLERVTGVLSSLAAAATALANQKAVSPLECLKPGEAFKSARSQYDEAYAKVNAYNVLVKKANAAISAKKAAAEAGDATLVRGELLGLQGVKRRLEPDADGACREYSDANHAKERVEQEKEEAKSALDTHGGTILPEFQKRINQALRHFGAGFRIQNVQTRYAGGRASSNYQILINEMPVELGDSSTPIGERSFRNTLSAGDRSTLALVFFLAQLELDRALADKVVVLDDPFTSQDTARRTCTQQRICRLVDKARQIIVLSHEASFLRQVYDAVPDSRIVKTLQLARVGPDDTLVAEWDIVEATRTSYHKDYLVLHRYLNEGQGEPRYVARTIRPLLEGYLRTLFPNVFRDNEWLGDFIAKIRNSPEEDNLSNMGPGLDELEDLNDYSKRYHHNTNPGGAETEPVDGGELRTYVQRNLDFVSAPPWMAGSDPAQL